jgi:uncharacterized protein (TIGR04255 family)
MKLPTRLSTEPLVEVICETRFDAASDSAVNLLPGILHEALGPFEHQHRLISLPPQMLAVDAAFAVQPQIRLSQKNLAIQIGARTVSVLYQPPYPGWSDFSAYVQRVFDVVCKQSFITGFNWLSLKYIDLLQIGASPRISWLNAENSLGGRRLDAEPQSMRVEYVEPPWTTVTQIVCPAQRVDSQEDGLLVDVDVIYRRPFDDFRNQYRDVLRELHQRNKAQFFSLLTDETLAKLGPEY